MSATGVVSDITNRLQQGEVGGLLDVRDRLIPEYMQEVDELAFNVAQEVNAVHRAGFGLDAVGGRDLFVPIAAVAGAALDMRVEAGVMADPDQLAAATDPLSVPGDNRNLIALTGSQVTRQAALGNVSFNSYFSEIVRGIGSAVSQNDQNSDLHEARFAQSEASEPPKG